MQQINIENNIMAVSVKDLSFGYSKGKDILTDITLNVPKGKIYSLLGSSGCGKTTLLRIILDRLKPRKGSIQVLGTAPQSIKPTFIGYMSQELFLFGNFTIEETMYYFGMLHLFSKEEIQQKSDFFIKLLSLPENCQVNRCSGGQQRRTSLAVTMLHNPQLLILDEPTAGVDPLLRCQIWNYLESLCLENSITVIITTHYIEESRNAHNLAFMRFGRILVEDTPNNLLNKFNCHVLEDVFFELCKQDCVSIKQKSIKQNNQNQSIPTSFQQNQNSKSNKFLIERQHLDALFFKNITNLKRNPLAVCFFLILPVIQIVLFCCSVYKLPNNLNIAVYSGESDRLSSNFIHHLDTSTVNVKYFNSSNGAIQAVRDGKSWYAIITNSRFSKTFKSRLKNPFVMDDDAFNDSRIALFVDHSDSYMRQTIYSSLFESYRAFAEGVADSIGLNPQISRLPVSIHEIVYGQYNSGAGYDMLHSLTPSILVVIIYTTPLMAAAFVLVFERTEGMLERTLINGASPIEVFITHLVSLMIGLAVQITLLMAVAIFVFEIRFHGSFSEICILLYLQGFCGIMIGLLISCYSKNAIVAMGLSLAMIFPMWMMCGVFWPLESVVQWLEHAFWCLPLTYPIRSMQLIIKRGWSWQYVQVQTGYWISVLYNCALLLCNVIAFHRTSK